MPTSTRWTEAELRALLAKHGSWSAAARAIDVKRNTLMAYVYDYHLTGLTTEQSRSRLTPGTEWVKDREELRKRLQQHGSPNALAVATQISCATADRWIAKHSLTPDEWTANPDDYGIPQFGEDLTLYGDWAVTGDYHLPYSDPAMIKLLLRMSRAWGIRNLLIAGDYLDLDQFSQHNPLAKTASWGETKALAQSTLQQLSSAFDQVVWTLGNHEQRITALTKGAWGLPELVNVMEAHNVRGVVSPGIIISSPQGDWDVVHPASYSRIPTRVAASLANLSHRNIISFHGHLSGSRWDESGNYRVVDAGMMGRENVAYRRLKRTTHPNWNQGFVILRKGYAYPIDPRSDLLFWERAGGSSKG